MSLLSPVSYNRSTARTVVWRAHHQRARGGEVLGHAEVDAGGQFVPVNAGQRRARARIARARGAHIFSRSVRRSTIQFSGLMSRCVRPLEWMYFTPDITRGERRLRAPRAAAEEGRTLAHVSARPLLADSPAAAVE